jgi:transglutaminase-like putative cysteine protease
MSLLRRPVQIQPPPSSLTLRWLTVGVLLTQALHAFHLPMSLATVGPILALLSYAMHRRGWRLPSLVLVLIAATVAFAVRKELGYLIGRDPGVAFLALAAGIKLMEVRTRRDVSFLLCLIAFLLPTVFFYGHAIATTLAVIGVAVVLLGALVATRDDEAPLPWRAALRLAGTLALHGLPVALALFVLFPRLSGPLWTLTSERVGRTGLSERMDPGMVSKLSLSDDIAFRVDFEGEVPAARDLYWRGPVLTQFDGRGWSTSLAPGEGRVLVEQGRSISYRVSLEPHDRFWLFALDLAASVPPEARLTREQQLFSLQPVSQALQYRQTSILADRYPARHADELRQALSLPYSGNRRAREWAATLRQESTNPGDLVDRVLGTFRREAFYYTLEPPEYAQDGIDAFLFDQRRGFCEHYAGAFAFLMRAAGIPARVVTGYQGGEMSPVGGYMIVRRARLGGSLDRQPLAPHRPDRRGRARAHRTRARRRAAGG